MKFRDIVFSIARILLTYRYD